MKKIKHFFEKNWISLLFGIIILIIIVYCFKYFNEKTKTDYKEETKKDSTGSNVCLKLSEQDMSSTPVINEELEIIDSKEYILFSINKDYNDIIIYVLATDDNTDYYKNLVFICEDDQLLLKEKTSQDYFAITKIELAKDQSSDSDTIINKEYFKIIDVGVFNVKTKKILTKENIIGEIWTPTNEFPITMISPNYVSTENNIIDMRTGNTILRNNYYDEVIVDDVEPLYFRVAKDNKYGLINREGIELIPIENEFIARTSSNSYYATMRDGYLKVYNNKFSNILSKSIFVKEHMRYEPNVLRPAGEGGRMAISENNNQINISLSNGVEFTSIKIDKEGSLISINNSVLNSNGELIEIDE